jgi:hypothetical protein
MKSTLRDLRPSSTPPPRSTGSRVTVRPRSGSKFVSMKLRDLKPSSTPPPPPVLSTSNRVTRYRPKARPVSKFESMKSTLRDLKPSSALPPPLTPSTGSRVTFGQQSPRRTLQPKLVALASKSPLAPSTGTRGTVGPHSGPVAQPDQNQSVRQVQQPMLVPLSIPKSPPPTPSPDIGVTFGSQSEPVAQPDQNQSLHPILPPKSVTPPSIPQNTNTSKSPPPAPALRTSPSGPGLKETSARKRPFSEIIDLTTFSDEDSEASRRAPSIKHLQTPPSGNAVSNQSMQPTATKDQQPAPAPTPIAAPTEALQRPDITPAAPQISQSQFASTPSNETSREALRKRYDLIKPLDKANALWRPSYHRDTIARDILIASGRHPTERPLNQHLQSLLDRFQNRGVNNKSDLETFQWDLIDPGGPPMPVVEAEDIFVEPSKAAGSREKEPARDSPRLAASASPGQQQPQSLGQSHSSSHLNGEAPDRPGKTAATRMDSLGRPSRPGMKSKNLPKVSSRAGATQLEGGIAKTSSPPASYATYRCRWEGCQAGLHDLNTLEKHVAKNHVPDRRFCRWLRCPDSQIEFVNDGLGLHLHKAHISPMAWKLGDGPSVTRTGENPAPGSNFTSNIGELR